MEKFLLRENIGEFFTKMYEANKGENIEVTLMFNDNKIQIYNKTKVMFKDVEIIDEQPTLDGLIKSLSE